MGVERLMFFWQPTFERVVEVLERPDQRCQGCEAILVAPTSPDLQLVERINGRFGQQGARFTLLIPGDHLEMVGYGLLRRLQARGWILALGESTDHLLERLEGASICALEKSIELVHKFRIDVDFFLTLPSEGGTPEQAVRLFRFLTAHRIRRVSFGFPLLLGRMGLCTGATAGPSSFFPALLEAWRRSDRALHLEDLHRLAEPLIAHRIEGRESLSRSTVDCFDADDDYGHTEGPIPELRGSSGGAEPPGDPAARSQDRCLRSCEYFLVCGGGHFGAKYWFNGTLDSSHNPYCELVAKPVFDQLLAV